MCGHNRMVRLKEILIREKCMRVKKALMCALALKPKEGKDGFKGIQKERKKEPVRQRQTDQTGAGSSLSQGHAGVTPQN